MKALDVAMLNARLNMRSLRLSTGMPLRLYGPAVGIGWKSVNNYEIGHRKPSLTALIKVAKYHGVTIDTIVFGTVNE